jgi:hypothetical protein
VVEYEPHMLHEPRYQVQFLRGLRKTLTANHHVDAAENIIMQMWNIETDRWCPFSGAVHTVSSERAMRVRICRQEFSHLLVSHSMRG